MTLEEKYSLHVGSAHRENFAQYFTHPIIASFMVRWVLRSGKSKRVFDPAFGLGAFYKAAPKGTKFQASELDATIINFLREHSGTKLPEIKCQNYLQTFGNKYDNIVANPPYQKFHEFENKNCVIAEFARNFGIKLSGYINIASAFLVKSIFELNETGRLAYIMPSEFLNAGYGTEIKKLLIKEKHLYGIISVRCEEEAFKDVLTSVCILLYDKQNEYEHVGFYSVKRIDEFNHESKLVPLRRINVHDLDPVSKWGVYFEERVILNRLRQENLVPLKTYGTFSRGIATGANHFFVLSPEDIDRLSLSPTDYIPCITRSNQIHAPVFTHDMFLELTHQNAPVFLFSPHNPSPQAKEYIAEGEKNGFNCAYLVKHRPVWYIPEQKPVPRLFLNVFSRGGYRVVLNEADVNTLTNYHCFHVKAELEPYLEVLFIYLYSQIGHSIVSLAKRRYGRELDKFEPNDLNNALVPSPAFFQQIDRALIDHAITMLRNGEGGEQDFDYMFEGLFREAH